MKTCYILLIACLCFVVLLCFMSYTVQRQCDELLLLQNAILQTCLMQDWNETAVLFDQLENRWETRKPFWMAVIAHSELDEAEDHLSEIRCALRVNDPDTLLTACELLGNRLHCLRTRTEIRWFNLL